MPAQQQSNFHSNLNKFTTIVFYSLFADWRSFGKKIRSWRRATGLTRRDTLIQLARDWNHIQYKSLKVIRNGGKSKKSKTSFGASPIEDLYGFYQRPFPEERISDFNFIQFRKCLPKFSSLHRCHDGLVVRVLGFS